MTTETEVVTDTTDNQTQQEVTLDDVYRDAGLDKIADTSTQTQQSQTTRQEVQQTTTKVEPSSVPDPYDSENFKAFMARQATGQTEMQQAVRAMAQHLTATQQEKAVAATKADIENAVKAIDEVVGIGKPKVIEAYLDGMVREDPRMKALWDNRAKNPTAWANATKIAAKKMAEDFSLKVDPNLVAAQRARKDSQRQMATTSSEAGSSAVEERLSAAQGMDFDAEWQLLLGAQ